MLGKTSLSEMRRILTLKTPTNSAKLLCLEEPALEHRNETPVEKCYIATSAKTK